MSDACLLCLFLRGPQPVTRATRTPVFEHFFWSHFLMPFWSQMVSPREPKIAQNRQKSCSRGLPESTRQKVTKNDAIWEGWICNPHTPVQSKHTFSFSRFGQKSDPKSLPKWSLGAPQITKNQEKWALKKTLKIASKKYQKLRQKGTPFSWRKGLQNHKNPRYLQNGPPGLQNEPPGLQNHSKS